MAENLRFLDDESADLLLTGSRSIPCDRKQKRISHHSLDPPSRSQYRGLMVVLSLLGTTISIDAASPRTRPFPYFPSGPNHPRHDDRNGLRDNSPSCPSAFLFG